MRPWYLVAVKARGDLAEALPGGAVAWDAPCDLGWDGWLASPRRRLDSRSRGASPLSRESLELVDGNQAGAPGQLDRLDVREQAAEGRAADAERLGGLAAGVGEPFHLGRFAHHHPRRRRRLRRTSGLVSQSETAARFVGAASLSAAGHGVQRTQMIGRFCTWVHLCLAGYCCTEQSGRAPAQEPSELDRWA